MSFVCVITDVAKFENNKDLTVYTYLESDAILTVNFQMNPVNNYTVNWLMGGQRLKNTNVRDVVDGEHVQTFHLISDVINKHLGNYTVRVINWAIENEHNEATFHVILKLRGKKSNAGHFYSSILLRNHDVYRNDLFW